MDDLENLLIQFARGMSAQFGENCEIVIHDVTKGLENTIIHIENGHVTQRKEGGSGSKVVFDALNTDPSELHDHLAYLTRTEDGRTLKSSTLYIRHPDSSLAYIFSVNYDISALVRCRRCPSLAASHRGRAEAGREKRKPSPDYTQCQRSS